MMEPNSEEFRLFHRYNKLVRRQMVKPLTCAVCDTPLITALGPEDELVLECIGCDTAIAPGVGTIDKVRAVVKEHFIDD